MIEAAVGLGGRRVLVVEDESMISMMIEDALTDLGCDIAAIASRFDDALTKATNLSFDIAILDVNLNGKQTYPIAEALKDREIPFVFATGYGATNVPDALSGAPILQKPFASRDLERALRAALHPA